MRYFWLALRYYATFRGRTNLTGFWVYSLIVAIITLICYGIPFTYTMQQMPAMLHQSSTMLQNYSLNIPWYLSLLSNFGTLFSLATLIPSLAISCRRLHDSGHSGALLWLMLLPVIGAIILLVFFSMASTPGDNRYGPNPNTNPTGTVV